LLCKGEEKSKARKKGLAAPMTKILRNSSASFRIGWLSESEPRS
jgi:hypothetical protein